MKPENAASGFLDLSASFCYDFYGYFCFVTPNIPPSCLTAPRPNVVYFANIGAYLANSGSFTSTGFKPKAILGTSYLAN